MTAPWSEPGIRWINTASDYDAAVEGSFTPSATGWVSVDLTDLVQAWVCGTANHGLMFLSTSTDFESKYASKEWDTVSQRPCVEATVSAGGGCSSIDHFSISGAGCF